MQQTINIVIDGPIALGKTAVGKLLAEKLQYQFIDSGLFYCYLGYNYSKKPINNQIIFLKDLKNKLNKQQFLFKINSIEQLND
ncbi:3546_t:CDS:1 [Dentiscutata erythropus]|uniref:(d)CMP kinase n=1 Tax=Dentiscutata erythropus TaxID=1348616 RepID=A0A9N9PK82_9GLOM|nr:3546_t:CDS:1 [Dentiscutata erythropus]